MSFELLFEIPRYQQEQHPQEDCLAAKREGEWVRYPTREVIDCMDQVSLGLLNLGVQPGDKIAIVSDSRPEWNFLDLGMQQIGAINVPVYPRINQETYKYIFNQAEVKIVFAENAELYEKVQKVRDDAPSVKQVYTFEEVEGAEHWHTVLRSGVNGNGKTLEARRAAVNPDDLVTIIYTSGTTGQPKGVMLSHQNIISNLRNCRNLLPVKSGHRALSFLPLNHVFERMLAYLYMAAGVSIYYAEDISTIGDNLREIKPQIFTTVPRLLEKVYERIVSAGMEENLLKRMIFFWALNLAHDYKLPGRGWFYDAQLNIANRLVFDKWRQALGGEVEAVISGGAALNPKLARVFTAAGVPILEGYGLTETSPVLAVNRIEVEGRRFGSVGRPIENVEIKIADDGEILCKGPNVTRGYYKKDEATEQAFDEHGWFHTGDVGKQDEDGFLYVTDRKKSVFKTSGGKYVAPQSIENHFKESYLVDQVMLIGEDRKMVTALIAPDFENLKDWCQKKDVECEWSDKKQVLENEAVRSRFDKMVSKKNKDLNHVEQVKKFRLVSDEWTVESGELTPTMKVKREVVEENYEDIIEAMYA